MNFQKRSWQWCKDQTKDDSSLKEEFLKFKHKVNNLQE